MIWKPHVTVAAVVESDGRFLLVEEMAGGHKVFNQPAGHLDPGETLLEAVIRETLEETACHFKPDALCGIYQWTHPKKKITFLRFAFCGSVSSQDADRTLDDGILQSLWLTRDQIVAKKNQHRSPMVLRCIDDYLAGTRYPTDIVELMASGHQDQIEAS